MAACRKLKHALLTTQLKASDINLLKLIGQRLNYVPALSMSSRKHYDPKFRKERAAKTQWIDPRYENVSNMTFDEQRKIAKQRGVHVPKEDRRSTLRNDSIAIDQSARVFDSYVPHEADGRLSALTKEGLNHLTKEVPKSKLSDLRSRRILKKYEDGFKKNEMANELQSVYVQSINLLNDIKKNQDELLDYVTLYCFGNLLTDFKKRTVQWKFLETVQPPKIVAIRTFEESLKDNMISQITLRIYSKQTLAVYDQFGRLMIGDPNLVKTILEFVVFEKHIVDTYGRWRVHAKITPDWMKPQSTVVKTSLKK